MAWQILPRDAENLNLRRASVGDHIYATVFINLFSKDIQTFARLFARTLQTRIPSDEFRFCLKAMGWKEQVLENVVICFKRNVGAKPLNS